MVFTVACLVRTTLSFTLASLVSAIGMLMGKLTWKTPVAMGPYLLLGFFVFAAYPLMKITSEALS